ncbi:MAG TPA: hypothetical protein VN782_10455 [Usitatibacter sp.]|nr:hypothetical protein [Usitatibacter sp.]
MRKVLAAIAATVASTVLLLVIRIPWMLAEDAVVTWINHEIAKEFQVESVSMHDAVRLFVSWGLPAALAVLIVAVTFRIARWSHHTQTAPGAKGAEPSALAMATGEAIRELAQRVPAQSAESPAQTPPSLNYGSMSGAQFEDLRRLSNPELRDRAIVLTREMRAYEANFRSQESIRMHTQWARSIPQNQTPEERSAQWRADRLSDEHARAHFQRELMVRLYPRAIAFREEIATRLGIFAPYPQGIQSTLLDHGMLAGVNPVTEAADVLERLARELP